VGFLWVQVQAIRSERWSPRRFSAHWWFAAIAMGSKETGPAGRAGGGAQAC